DIEHLQDRRVGIGEPHLQILAVVAVRVGAERRRVPDIVLAVAQLLAADIRAAGSADAEIHLRRVVPDRRRLLAGLEHAQHAPYAGRETIAGSGCARMNEHRLASPVGGARKRGQPLGLGGNLLAGDDDRLPKIERRRSGCAADVAKDGLGGLGHAAVSSLAEMEMRGLANPGCGSARPAPDACARRRISMPSATSEMPIPIGLNSDRSVPAGRGRAAATIAEIVCTGVQSPRRAPSYQSMNSAL